MSIHVPNKYRARTGWHGTDDSIGNNGAFFVPNGIGRAPLQVIASDGLVVPADKTDIRQRFAQERARIEREST